MYILKYKNVHLLLELSPILPLGTISALYDQAIQPGTLKQTWIFTVNAAYNQTFNSFCFLPSQPATLLCNNEALEWARWGLREIQQNTESLSADVCISGSGDGSGVDRRMNRWPWERIGDGGWGWAFSKRIAYSSPSVGEKTHLLHRESIVLARKMIQLALPNTDPSLERLPVKSFWVSTGLTKHIILLFNHVSFAVHHIYCRK